MSRLAAVATLGLSAGIVAGCGLHPRSMPESSAQSADQIVITRDEITRLGVGTAWEAIKRRVPQLTWRENGAGQPTHVWRHGRGSINLNENPLLFVDNVRIDDIRVLGDIPAGQVELIRILSGLAATTQFGTNAATGVILVSTRNGST